MPLAPAIDEHQLSFLRSVFPAGTLGYVRFVIGVPGAFPQETHFLTVDEIHACEELPFSTLEKEVYFTPHPFSRKDFKVTKEDALNPRTLWLECDDKDFNPLSISLGPPSAVVESSPGRTHSYWFLDREYAGREIEVVNRSLAYKYLTKDRSGWPLTKLLRVPGTLNRKYAETYEVRLLTFIPGRRYRLADFDDVPRVHGSNEELQELPDAGRLPTRDEVLERWDEFLPMVVKDLLNTRQTDRSRALWRISNEFHRLGVPQSDAFVLLLDSVNDKFSDNRFGGEAALWKDINLAYKLSTSTDRKTCIKKIKDIRNARMSPTDKFEEISKLVHKTMAMEGRFYYSPRTAEAIFYMAEDNKMITLGPNSLDCRTFLGTAFQINGMTQEFKYVSEHLRAWTEHSAPHIEIRDLSYFDKDAHILYVTDYRGGIYRLNGTTIEYVDNGVDGGIFFRPVAGGSPYSPTFGSSRSLLDDLIFGRTNMPSEKYPAAKARFLIKAWTYSLFFSDAFETRPLLIMEGPHGSGKSMGFKCIEWLLRGPKAVILKLPEGPKAFRENVRERSHVFFDGVDAPFKGLAELLSTTATGTVERVRILYTDNRVAEYMLRAFIGITTMDAQFLRNDVADRSIILRAERRGDFLPESVIKTEVLERRDELWGALLEDLNRVVLRMQRGKLPPTRLRMADFCQILFALCEVYDQEPDWYIKFLRDEQDSQVLRRFGIWPVLSLWLKKEGNKEHPINAGDLHLELTEISFLHGMRYSLACKSPAALGMKLKKIQPHLPHIKELDPQGNKFVYTFPRD